MQLAKRTDQWNSEKRQRLQQMQTTRFQFSRVSRQEDMVNTVTQNGHTHTSPKITPQLRVSDSDSDQSSSVASDPKQSGEDSSGSDFSSKTAVRLNNELSSHKRTVLSLSPSRVIDLTKHKLSESPSHIKIHNKSQLHTIADSGAERV